MSGLNTISQKWQLISSALFRKYPAIIANNTIVPLRGAVGTLASGWKAEKRRCTGRRGTDTNGTIPVIVDIKISHAAERVLAQTITEITCYARANGFLGSSVFCLTDRGGSWLERLLAICNAQVCPVDLQIFTASEAFQSAIDLAMPTSWETTFEEVMPGVRIPTGMNLTTGRLALSKQDQNLAREFMKTHGLHDKFVCVSSADIDDQLISETIQICAAKAPHIKFITLNTQSTQGAPSPNVFDANQAGFTFIDKIALADKAEAYLGTDDVIAFAACTSEKPIFLTSFATSSDAEWQLSTPDMNAATLATQIIKALTPTT